MKAYRIKNILVPTDFSFISRNAIHHAEQIAKKTHARITLLNVVEPVNDAFGTSGMLGALAHVEEKQQRAAKKELDKLARASMKRSGVHIGTIATIGRIAPMVSRAVAKTKADLIVMGTHGAGGFFERFLGSTTYRVASLTRIPLLSVHKRMAPPGYANIVYPVREHRQVMDKFPQALMFAKLFKSRVRIIGLLKPDQKGYDTKVKSQCAAIRKQFTAHRIVAETSYTRSGFFPEAAIRYAHSHSGSLVVIVQDTDFHLVELFQGTFTKTVLHNVLSPVLTVPDR